VLDERKKEKKTRLKSSPTTGVRWAVKPERGPCAVSGTAEYVQLQRKGKEDIGVVHIIEDHREKESTRESDEMEGTQDPGRTRGETSRGVIMAPRGEHDQKKVALTV